MSGVGGKFGFPDTTIFSLQPAGREPEPSGGLGGLGGRPGPERSAEFIAARHKIFKLLMNNPAVKMTDEESFIFTEEILDIAERFLLVGVDDE